MVKVRSWLDYHSCDEDFVQCDAGTVNEEPSRTQQHFADMCNINNLINTFPNLDSLPLGCYQAGTPMYGDFSDIPDYHRAQHIMLEARSLWENMPKNVKDRFDGPLDYLRFTEDSANYDEAVRLGLISPAKPAGGSEDPPASGSGST